MIIFVILKLIMTISANLINIMAIFEVFLINSYNKMTNQKQDYKTYPLKFKGELFQLIRANPELCRRPSVVQLS